MSHKIATALIAATTLAFSAPAFAASPSPAPSPADEVIETGTTADTQTVVTIEPVIEVNPVVGTQIPDLQPTTILQPTPLTTSGEIAGEVITTDTYIPETPDVAQPLELEDGSAELAQNLDGFNQDNSQLDVDSPRNTITLGAKR